MHNFVLLCLVFISSSTLANTPVNDASFTFVGVAHDIDSNAVLYKESHAVILNQEQKYKTTSVQYEDAQGEVFAKKSLDFTQNLLAPSVYFKDSRVGTLVEVESTDSGLNVNYESVSDSAEAMIKAVPRMVVDAGFDQMMLKNWDALLNNKPMDFEFLAPTRAELIGFTLTPLSQDEAVIKFRLAPSNFVLRLLVDPIKLTYDKQTKRILTYEGLTNIEEVKQGKPTGEYYVARIDYAY